MVEVASRRGDAAVPELLGDDPDVHALGAELGRVGVPEPDWLARGIRRRTALRRQSNELRQQL